MLNKSGSELNSMVKKWTELAPASGKWDTLLLGNGASCALSKKFSYPSLYEVARPSIDTRTQAIFQKLRTSNFEEALFALHHTDIVSASLGLQAAEVQDVARSVRDALIGAVRSTHCTHSDVVVHLRKIGLWLKNFRTVVTFNYDITLYWAYLWVNSDKSFADGFYNDDLDPDVLMFHPLRDSKRTNVYYAHGGLMLIVDGRGREVKIRKSLADNKFIEVVTKEWEQSTPLFVSEGTREHKLDHIRRSPYLKHVYEKVLCQQGGKNVAIYGLSLHENDGHIIEALAKNPPASIAIGIYVPSSDEADQYAARQTMRWVSARIKAARSLEDVPLEFFDSSSPGCWLHEPPGYTEVLGTVPDFMKKSKET